MEFNALAIETEDFRNIHFLFLFEVTIQPSPLSSLAWI